MKHIRMASLLENAKLGPGYWWTGQPFIRSQPFARLQAGASAMDTTTAWWCSRLETSEDIEGIRKHSMEEVELLKMFEDSYKI